MCAIEPTQTQEGSVAKCNSVSLLLPSECITREKV